MVVLVNELKRAGARDVDALRLLREAPDKLEAALTRGKRALVLFRLTPENPRSIVSDDDERLKAFAKEATDDGVRLYGINPTLIAAIAQAARAVSDTRNTHGDEIQ